MKDKKIFTILALSAIISMGGCSQDNGTVSSVSKQENVNSVTDISQASADTTDTSQVSLPEKSEISHEEEPSVDEKKINTDQARKDIAVLAEYKRGIEPVKDINWPFNSADGGFGHCKGKLHYVDSVIRDINDDGIYELIVKYDLRSENFPNSEAAWTIYNSYPAYTYEIVSVVNGKAVATEHYLNEEGIFHQGEAK